MFLESSCIFVKIKVKKQKDFVKNYRICRFLNHHLSKRYTGIQSTILTICLPMLGLKALCLGIQKYNKVLTFTDQSLYR